MIPFEVLDKKQELSLYIQNLGIDTTRIKDENLMLISFIHKSYAADFRDSVEHNERLEFLWDAILGAVVAKYLFSDYIEFEESTLTLYKIVLVREETLAQVAKDIQLDKMIFLWKGEENNDGRNKDSILSDALEALIWYIYIDLWYLEVEKFIKKYVYTRLDKIDNINIKSYKSLLQEKVQQLYKIIPEYETTEYERGEKDNILSYKSCVYVMGKMMWEWYWPNKKKAQEEAAEKAFNKLEENNTI